MKPSKTALCPVPELRPIAGPAEVMVPPYVAEIDAPVPSSRTDVVDGSVVVTLIAAFAVTEPAWPLLAKSLATMPVENWPDVEIVVGLSIVMPVPAPSASSAGALAPEVE